MRIDAAGVGPTVEEQRAAAQREAAEAERQYKIVLAMRKAVVPPTWLALIFYVAWAWKWVVVAPWWGVALFGLGGMVLYHLCLTIPRQTYVIAERAFQQAQEILSRLR